MHQTEKQRQKAQKKYWENADREVKLPDGLVDKIKTASPVVTADIESAFNAALKSAWNLEKSNLIEQKTRVGTQYHTRNGKLVAEYFDLPGQKQVQRKKTNGGIRKIKHVGKPREFFQIYYPDTKDIAATIKVGRFQGTDIYPKDDQKAEAKALDTFLKDYPMHFVTRVSQYYRPETYIAPPRRDFDGNSASNHDLVRTLERRHGRAEKAEFREIDASQNGDFKGLHETIDWHASKLKKDDEKEAGQNGEEAEKEKSDGPRMGKRMRVKSKTTYSKIKLETYGGDKEPSAYGLVARLGTEQHKRPDGSYIIREPIKATKGSGDDKIKHITGYQVREFDIEGNQVKRYTQDLEGNISDVDTRRITRPIKLERPLKPSGFVAREKMRDKLRFREDKNPDIIRDLGSLVTLGDDPIPNEERPEYLHREEEWQPHGQELGEEGWAAKTVKPGPKERLR